MKRTIGLMGLVFAGIVAWRVVDGLSSDALSMGIGVLCGVLAGVPMALLVLASTRRSVERPTAHAAEYGMGYPRYQQQPPVIVVTGNGQTPQGQGWGGAPYPPGLPSPDGWDGPRAARDYRLVGEQEDWGDE